MRPGGQKMCVLETSEPTGSEKNPARVLLLPSDPSLEQVGLIT